MQGHNRILVLSLYKKNCNQVNIIKKKQKTNYIDTCRSSVISTIGLSAEPILFSLLSKSSIVSLNNQQN